MLTNLYSSIYLTSKHNILKHFHLNKKKWDATLTRGNISFINLITIATSLFVILPCRVQVRRTDKLLREARFIKLEEYMEAVDDFFDDLEIRGTNVTSRRIYLATDDPRVLQEARTKSVKELR